ncbi:MAG: electron transport complex subunit E [Clostridiales bacterium]|nr:electron transport complex subunit E [Clostridiales bacterium]
MNKLKVLSNGIIRENPVLVLILGTCPALAVSTQASNAIGMGIAAMIVLVCSNVAISALRNVIPDNVRIPCYIVLIAGFVTIVQMLVQAYAPVIDEQLGIFLPLIVVNCIILGRAEMFANKNTVGAAALDGIGMGLGFMLALLVMASIREIFGSGTWFGMEIPVLIDHNISILTLAPGGFFVYGLLIALINKMTNGKASKNAEKGCMGCPAAAACGKLEDGGEKEVKL